MVGKKNQGLAAVKSPAKVKDLPFVEVELRQGEKYKLCFDMVKLGEAEARFIAQGHDASLLFCFVATHLNLNRVMRLFAAAAHTYHPELGFEGAEKLITPDTVYLVANPIYDFLTPAPAKSADGTEQEGSNASGEEEQGTVAAD